MNAPYIINKEQKSRVKNFQGDDSLSKMNSYLESRLDGQETTVDMTAIHNQLEKSNDSYLPPLKQMQNSDLNFNPRHHGIENETIQTFAQQQITGGNR